MIMLLKIYFSNLTYRNYDRRALRAVLSDLAVMAASYQNSLSAGFGNLPGLA